MIYDKELIINGEAVRSPEQQVYKNMKDIKELKNIITLQEEYACTIDLATNATTVAKSYTNAGEEVKSGWLIDPHANKFKITGGDDSNLLIEFYASYRGPAGASGASAIDDTGTANDKVWSSQKTNTEITNVNDKGIFFTTISPTPSDGHYTIETSELSNFVNVNQLKFGDLVLYINGGVPNAIYKVISLYDLPTVTMDLVGTFSSGKQLYEHHIVMTSGGALGCFFVITSDRSTAYDLTDLKSYLSGKGFTSSSSPHIAVGFGQASSNDYDIYGVFVENDTIKARTYMRTGSVWGKGLTFETISQDTVVEL